MTTAEKIAVMQAFLDGKPIQERWLHDPEWMDLKDGEFPDWHWGKKLWRIKPEPKQPVLREWKPEEVPLDAWFKEPNRSFAFRITEVALKDEEFYLEDSSWVSVKDLKEGWLHSFAPFDPDSWKECGVRE